MLVSFQNFVLNFLSGCSGLLALCVLLPPNRFFRLGVTAYLAGQTIYIGISFLVLSEPIGLLNSTWNIVFYLLALCCFRVSAREALATIVVFTSIGAVCSIIMVFPGQALGIMVDPFVVSRKEDLWLFFVSVASLVVLYTTIIRLMQRFPVWRKLPMWVVLSFVILTWGATVFWDTRSLRFQNLENSLLIVCTIALSFSATCCFFFYEQWKTNQEKSRLLWLQQEARIHYYQLVTEDHLALQQFRTEVHDQIDSLKESLEGKEFAQSSDLLRQLHERIRTTKPLVSTGNVAIDALLQSKLAVIKQKGCRLEVAFELKNSCGVRDIDLICILANLMDNALHAMQEGETLWASGRVYGGMCVLAVKNPAHGGENFPKKFSELKFSENGHGVGLTSVQSTVDRYDGQLSLCVENGMVTARATMIVEQTEKGKGKSEKFPSAT